MNTNPKSTKDAAGTGIPAAFGALLDSGFEAAARIQKETLDVAAQQAAHLMSAAAGVETVIEVQKALLDVASQQNKTVAGAVKRQAEIGVGAIQSGVDAVIESQRGLLDAASKTLKNATGRS